MHSFGAQRKQECTIKLEAAVPGSEVRLYFAGALYRIPEAVEAMEPDAIESIFDEEWLARRLDASE